jgi:protein-S-isoprenylcysteine O-methyltransferase Ste14
MDLSMLFFWLGILSSSAMLVLMIASVLSENFRFWPPENRNLKWLTYWILASINTAAILFLALSNFRPTPLSFLGAGVAFAGLSVTLVAIKNLSLGQTSGIDQGFVDQGLYSYSRNPQVIGNLISLLGIMMLQPLFEVVSISVLTGGWLIAMIFAEEQWLGKKYSGKYGDYREEVPRFI